MLLQALTVVVQVQRLALQVELEELKLEFARQAQLLLELI
jgi:hypothetical protein